MRFFQHLSWFIAAMLSVLVSACGGDDGKSNLESSQLIQDVRLTTYELKKASWDLSVNYFDGGDENLSKSNEFVEGKSKDKIQRILDTGKFFILTNGVKADRIVISPDGELQDEQTVEQKLTGCELKGTSKISGKATHLELQLEWKLAVTLDGDGCNTNEDLKKQFVAFIDNEVSRLNLKSAKDLFVSMEQARDQSRSMELKLSISGEINPKALQAPEAPGVTTPAAP